MYRFLLSRQWVIITLIALALIPVMIELGFWQLHRHQHRVAQNQQISTALAATPEPAEKLTAPGHRITAAEKYHRVSAKGRFDTAHEVVVRRRTNEAEEIGVHVLTPFVLKDGRVLLVNRGWVPANGAQTSFPKVPAPPKGEITVTGRLMPDETTAASGIKNIQGLPPRQVMLISSGEEADRLGRSVLGGFIEQTSPESPDDSPQLIPAPDDQGIGPHMAYAVQWWLFSAAVPLGWTVLVRRERRERRDRDRATAEPEPAPEPATV
ncbi:SURF1 family cytochrome oxidase biogenesis protein [Streptomyces tsukubensis]|uniref:SURF1-like protein n=1 Tax=Streptomyces tsukubensis TaxID=83656 RepID=A0A1V4A3L4_9ACTN|nr:SURF1 family protein [Streptomyces tsukubensis]OON74017.1 hypothetical protein B1H18_26255 [Streptomyces tsukubensis]QFR92936.1 SURF1 family protein [Streptomyces tsukubensis]